jgi:hypothetical protein
MDVKSTLLNGELIEDVYVSKPTSFTSTDMEDMVLLLDKPLYGLKQAPRPWNQKLD